jgi:REP element-mobilizing transposase RayT
MNDYHQPLVPEQTYHLFSRAVGNEKLFLSPGNYLFFLQKLKQHTSHVCDLYAYSLLPNHFHLLAKMKEEDEVRKEFEIIKKKKFNPLQHDVCDFIMERFSNFLNSYSKAFNKANKRKGALFMDYLKRSIVNKPDDFTSYTWYIHKNAVHHKLANSIGAWKYDSYQSLISEAPTALLRNEILEWFGGKEAFIKFHNQTIDPKIQFDDTDV